MRLFFVLGLVSLLFNFSSGENKPISKVSLGFSFSPAYAQYLGLDPRGSFLEILSRFNFESVRIPVYWDRVYRNGSYDFSEVDFLVKEAKKQGLEVVLSFGYRNFRWPECYAPDEVAEEKSSRFREELELFNRAVLDHFAPTNWVDAWQVENEPFLIPNSRCRFLNPLALQETIEQIKYSDNTNRPILLTFGGAGAAGLPLIWPAIKDADIIGVSFYPRILDPLFRRYYVETYRLGPVPPRKISRERRFVEGQGKAFWVVEFQAEPWADDPRTMSPEILQSNWELLLSYGGAERVYLWGVEWWLKEKHEGRPDVFRAAQKLFNLPFPQAGLE